MLLLCTIIWLGEGGQDSTTIQAHSILSEVFNFLGTNSWPDMYTMFQIFISSGNDLKRNKWLPQTTMFTLLAWILPKLLIVDEFMNKNSTMS